MKKLVEIYKVQGLNSDAAAYKKLNTVIAKSLEKSEKTKEAEEYRNMSKKYFNRQTTFFEVFTSIRENSNQNLVNNILKKNRMKKVLLSSILLLFMGYGMSQTPKINYTFQVPPCVSTNPPVSTILVLKNGSTVPNAIVQTDWTVKNSSGTVIFQQTEMGPYPTGVVNSISAAGKYTVIMCVTWTSLTRCDSTTITVYDLPQFSFQKSTDSICPGAGITFTPSMTPPFNVGMVGSYYWDFGGGGSSTQFSPTYPYNSTGNVAQSYSVKLTITDTNGCSKVVTMSDYVFVRSKPVVDFTSGTTYVCFGNNTTGTVHFTNKTDTNGSGSASDNNTYWWNLGDGSIDSSKNPTHVYGLGQYNVTLHTTNQYGCKDSLVKSNYISIKQVIPNYTVNKTHICSLPDTIVAQGLVPGLNYQWEITPPVNYNSGIFGYYAPFPMKTEAQYPGVTGTHSLIVTITDINSSSCKVSDTTTLYISDGSAVFADFISGAHQFPCLNNGRTIQFTNISQGNPTRFKWNFGDSASGSSAISYVENPAYTYQKAGKHDVTLIVSDSIGGCTNTMVKKDYVNILEKLNPNYMVSKTRICSLPDRIYVQGLDSNLRYHWEITPPIPGISQSFSQADTFEFNTNVPTGIYYLVLSVMDSTNSCFTSDTTTLYVRNGSALVANFISDIHEFPCPDNGPVQGRTVQFYNMSTVSNTNTAQYIWNFGDGSVPAYAKDPIHLYGQAGKYDVRLTVIDNGCSDDTLSKEYVVILGARGSISYQGNGGCLPLTVDFIPSIVLYDPYSPDSLAIFTGDGYLIRSVGSNQVKTRNYQYRTAGAYLPLYRLYKSVIFHGDTLLCVVQLHEKDTIYVVDLQPDFDTEPSYLPDVPITFTNTSQWMPNYLPLASLAWDFGNGDPVSTDFNGTTTYNAEGKYIVNLTMKVLGCVKNKSKTIEVTKDVSVVEVNGIRPIQLYPNPTTGKLTIAPLSPPEGGKQPTIEIFNVVGQKVNYQLSTVNYQLSIDISHLANGLYFLKIDNKMIKIIKN